MPGTVHTFPDADTLADEVAGRFLDRLAAAQDRGEVPHVGLTGGSIADTLHRAIARRAADSRVDWRRVVFWWGDERFLPADSPDRNARQAAEALLDRVPVEADHVHPVPASDEVAAAEDAAAAYSDTMRAQKHGPGAGTFEVLFLGLGPDGHIASLFPGHPVLGVDDRIAAAVHDSPKPPPDRVTLTFAALNHARAVWFVVDGSGKADAVAAAHAAGPVSEIPARGVAGTEETVWFLDDAAASQVTGRSVPPQTR